METFSALLALCAGNSSVTGEFPSQRPVARSFDGFFWVFYLRLNKRLSKQLWGWWFETPLSPLCRHCNGIALHWNDSSRIKGNIAFRYMQVRNPVDCRLAYIGILYYKFILFKVCGHCYLRYVYTIHLQILTGVLTRSIDVVFAIPLKHMFHAHKDQNKYKPRYWSTFRCTLRLNKTFTVQVKAHHWLLLHIPYEYSIR